MSSIDNLDTEMEWTAEEELYLFFALDGLKPVGVNKHFIMVYIVDRLSKSLNREVSTDAIWSYLRSTYNLQMLDQMEPLPFPNVEKDFCLPEEFTPFLAKKREADKKSDSSPSIIAVAMDNTGKDKLATSLKMVSTSVNTEKKGASKMLEIPKRTPKRTRGSISLESSSPSTTPPPVSSKRRRL